MLGGGQLGRYALMAARTMGYRTIVLDPDPSAPAAAVADEHLCAAFDDPAALRRLVIECDVVTTEFENPPAPALALIADAVRIAPSPVAVGIAQDRIAEKAFLVENGFPVGVYDVIDADRGASDVSTAVLDGGAVVKTARLGYDGKGQRRVDRHADVDAAWAELGGVPCVVEQRLDLLTELSVIVARTADGRTTNWPVAENTHVDGVLDLSIVPANVSADLADRAEGVAMALADALDYTGVLAVELFVVAGEAGPQLLVNELAPRPHNSGHWTLDASVTSQFEQQIRAVCGIGLGDTAMTCGGVAMVNLLGDLWSPDDPSWGAVLDDASAKLHLYGKSEPRPGRKMGHITVRSSNAAEAATRAKALRAAR
ncbi:MAG: 5-(carboxyamino)imidazole ribonucleotide synthase [Ilumatobacter sp.]|nr:5-(carboxyamino)imidazole ribonucleotide synthase [Ilumatobacter sp.]